MPDASSASRRQLFRLGAGAAALAALDLSGSVAARAAEPDRGDPWRGLKMGIASYTFSKLPLDPTIQAVKRVGVH